MELAEWLRSRPAALTVGEVAQTWGPLLLGSGNWLQIIIEDRPALLPAVAAWIADRLSGNDLLTHYFRLLLYTDLDVRPRVTELLRGDALPEAETLIDIIRLGRTDLDQLIQDAGIELHDPFLDEIIRQGAYQFVPLHDWSADQLYAAIQSDAPNAYRLTRRLLELEWDDLDADLLLSELIRRGWDLTGLVVDPRRSYYGGLTPGAVERIIGEAQITQVTVPALRELAFRGYSFLDHPEVAELMRDITEGGEDAEVKGWALYYLRVHPSWIITPATLAAATTRNLAAYLSEAI